jgi:hypothetical protein
VCAIADESFGMCSGAATVVDAITEAVSDSLPFSDATSAKIGAVSLSHPWYTAVSTALRAWDKEHGSDPTNAPNTPSEALQKLFLPPPDITFVSTVEQLAQAIDDSALDIVIENHMDLRGMPTDNLGYALPLSMNTRSIRVCALPHADSTACNCAVVHLFECNFVLVSICGCFLGKCVFML